MQAKISQDKTKSNKRKKVEEKEDRPIYCFNPIFYEVKAILSCNTKSWDINP